MLTSRKSIRLDDYDYSSQGFYFITICCFEKRSIFGEIINNEMTLNSNGKIALDEWFKTEVLRPNIKLHEFIVMPNHIHGIINIVHPVGASCCSPAFTKTTTRANSSSPLRGPSQTIGAIVRGYKAAVTVNINKFRNTPRQHVWQRNYHEHIIKNDESHVRIADYIVNNACTWGSDSINPSFVRPK
jgi:putative transposase